MMNQELTTDAIRDMYAEGLTSYEIGDMYGLNSGTVRGRAIRAGIVNPRGNGGPPPPKSVEEIALDMKLPDAVEYLIGCVNALQQVVVNDDVLRLRLKLTHLEGRLLSALVNSPGILTRDALMNAAYFDRPSYGDIPDAKLIAVYICRIRKKLPADFGHIETVEGFGYRFVRAS